MVSKLSHEFSSSVSYHHQHHPSSTLHSTLLQPSTFFFPLRKRQKRDAKAWVSSSYSFLLNFSEKTSLFNSQSAFLRRSLALSSLFLVSIPEHFFSHLFCVVSHSLSFYLQQREANSRQHKSETLMMIPAYPKKSNK